MKMLLLFSSLFLLLRKGMPLHGVMVSTKPRIFQHDQNTQERKSQTGVARQRQYALVQPVALKATNPKRQFDKKYEIPPKTLSISFASALLNFAYIYIYISKSFAEKRIFQKLIEYFSKKAGYNNTNLFYNVRTNYVDSRIVRP